MARGDPLSGEIHPMRRRAPRVIFGFRHVSGVPLCPCRDPGDYCSLEQPGDDPFRCLLRCWCGRTIQVTFESMAERETFIAAQGEPA